jgi:hypothetical protein
MDVEKEINEIKERNSRVELDKAWETSLLRRGFIAAITYIVALTWLVLIDETNVGLKAVVPVAGYLISTFSLPWLRGIWITITKK